jgi:hypothetical protein
MAQSYIITSFKHRTLNVVWRLSERHGSYTDLPDASITADNRIGHMKHLNDFLCNGDFMINSIKDKSRREHIEFAIGDVINQSPVHPIISFKIVNKDVMLVLTPRNASDRENTFRMVTAKKYVRPEPVVAKPKETTKITKEDAKDKFHQLRKSIEKTYAGNEIRLEKTLRKRKESLQEFLIKFFEEWNEEKDTIYVTTQEVQTMAGKRRSLGDIYMICKYYYPNVTLEEVIRLLYITLPAHFRGFRSCKCSQIHKRVWYYEDGLANNNANIGAADEYNHTMQYYIDKLNES